MYLRRLGVAGTQSSLVSYGTCGDCKQATTGCLTPTLRAVSPSSGMGNVAHTAKLWLTDPRKAIYYGSACPQHGARASSGEGLTGSLQA